MKIRTLKVILNSMVNWVKSNTSNLTNFAPGSVIRTILESVALEVEALYMQMHKGFRWALENSVLYTFGFKKREAMHAIGEIEIRFSDVREPLGIPKGTVFISLPSDSGISVKFETTEDVLVLPHQDSVRVQIKSIAPGTIGNVPPNYIRVAENPIHYYLSINNPESTSGGKDEETTEERKERFNMFIKSLSKGTPVAIKYGAMEVQPTDTNLEGVAGVHVVDVPGQIYVYAHDSKGELSDNLRRRIEENLVNYKSAGVEVLVFPADKKLVHMKVDIVLDPRIRYPEIYKNQIQNSLIDYINSFPVSKSLIKADIIRFVMSVGNGAVLNTKIDLEEDMINTNTYQVVRAGDITVELVKEV